MAALRFAHVLTTVTCALVAAPFFLAGIQACGSDADVPTTRMPTPPDAAAEPVDAGCAGAGTCVCAPGAVEQCYEGAGGTNGVGLCHGGEKVCLPDGLAWGPCAGQVLPTSEVCKAGELADEDCDGTINEEGEGCACVPGTKAGCYGGAGGLESAELVAPNALCKAGEHTCVADGTAFGACEGQVLPAAEVCNGMLADENCDGRVNESGTGCACAPGAAEACFDGPATAVFGGSSICKKGTRTCAPSGTWGSCAGQVLPQVEGAYPVTPSIDEDCDGDALDAAGVDHDGDGFSPAQGDCCEFADQCPSPKLVNPGAYDIAGNGIDDDCDGAKDNAPVSCDAGLASNSSTTNDYAKALGLCQTTVETPPITARKWGVISSGFSLAEGAGAPRDTQRSIRPGFGSSIGPTSGSSLVVLSTGAAADATDTNPNYVAFQGGTNMGTTGGFPPDWYAANGNKVPTPPGCPAIGSVVDSVMMKVRIRVPTNARSFSFRSFYLSAEYPEWVCSPTNDVFVALLESSFKGLPANPTDRNIASTGGFPITSNLSRTSNLFRVCKNGTTGCGTGAVPANATTCTSSALLAGTGMDVVDPGPKFPYDPGFCGANNLLGGGTGYLTSRGNVVPGETIEIRFAIWDSSDQWYDSLVLLDGFAWSPDLVTPGTTAN